jgi:hypothetical protein
VSHLKERREKNCLNCNAEVAGRYCQVCGQENVEIKESFWHLATHLVYDIMHFDSKFFDTLKYLLWRPGFLSKEYVRGRRAAYLHPIRMYVFTSAIFFIVFFSYVIKEQEGSDNTIKIETNPNEGKKTIGQQIQVLQDSLRKTSNPKQRKKIEDEIKDLKTVYTYIPSVKDEGKKDSTKSKEDDDDGKVINIVHAPATAHEYDSLQKTLPGGERDGWFKRLLIYLEIRIYQKYKVD